MRGGLSVNDYYVEPEKTEISENGFEFFINYIHSRDVFVSPHIHTAIEILFIIDGSFRVYADDSEFLLSEGDAVLFRSHTIHRVYPLKDGVSSYYVLKIRPSMILDFSSQAFGSAYLLQLSLSSKSSKSLWTREECEANGIRRSLLKLAEDYDRKDYGSDISAKICAAQILLAMLRDTEKPQELPAELGPADENLMRRIYNAVVYINSHYTEDLTARECGDRIFMSYSYFSRCFRRITGQSFKDYLNQTRINHAEKLLISSDKSITEVAAECGFNSVSYFICSFKKLKGVTPSVFRENNR